MKLERKIEGAEKGSDDEGKVLDFLDFRIGVATAFIAVSVFFGFLYQHIILYDRFGVRVVGIYDLKENFWHWFLLGIPSAIFFTSIFAQLRKSKKSSSDVTKGSYGEFREERTLIEKTTYVTMLITAISTFLMVNFLSLVSIIVWSIQSPLLMFFLTSLYAAVASVVSVNSWSFWELLLRREENAQHKEILHHRSMRSIWRRVMFIALVFTSAVIVYILYSELHLYYSLVSTLENLISAYLDIYLISLLFFFIAIFFYFGGFPSVLRNVYTAFTMGSAIISIIALNLFSTLMLPPSMGGFAGFALRVLYQLNGSRSNVAENEYVAILVSQNQRGLILETSRCGQQLTEAKREGKLTNFQARCLLYVPRENVKYVQTIPKITPRSQDGKH